MEEVCKAEVVGSDRRQRLAWRIETRPEDPNEAAAAGLEYQKKRYDLSALERFSPSEKAILMLRGAAEIEHDLLIEYLFTASSLEDPVASALVTDIAIEEMGHLLSVNNIMLALGHEPYFGRSAPYPSDPFPFKLRAGNVTTLASFTAAESPDPKALSSPERDELKAIFGVANRPDQLHPIQRVAILYERLVDLFSAKHDPPLIAAGAQHPRQAKHTESWARAGVTRNVLLFDVVTLDQVKHALQAIMSQGEGFLSDAASHFVRFRRIYRGMFGEPSALSRKFSALEPSGSPVRQDDVAKASELGLIARLVDVRYQMLVARLYSTLAREPTVERSSLIDANLREMRFVLAPLVQAIRQLAAASDACPRFYELPPDFDPYEILERRDLLAQRMRDTHDTAARLDHSSMVGAAKSALLSLREIDQFVGRWW